MTELGLPRRGWTRAERSRLAGVFGAIAALHVTGWTIFFWQASELGAAGGYAGAGTLAYALGLRHAFDADHIAAIDDTTRLMMLRGKRPLGVGFFFALGHSAVVLLLALLTALASAKLSSGGFDNLRVVGAEIAVAVAIAFLTLVAMLNFVVLRGLVAMWRQFRAGSLQRDRLDLLLTGRGLMNRALGDRARLIRSSWHMAPVGFLFGLGLETASEVTLLALSASTAHGGELPLLAVLSLPLLFAAGMSLMDTADSLLMSRAYSWAYEDPGRRLYYNIVTTGVTAVVGLFVASVYLGGALLDHVHVAGLGGYSALAEHFELFGYGIVALFLLAWGLALLYWKLQFGQSKS